MKILAINGTYRSEGTTTGLVRSFLEGVRSGGEEADMIMLRDRTIGYCTNCLKCYSFTGEGVAPCSQKDDMNEIIDRIVEADGVLFASPVHNGFVTGLMTVFWERLSWRVARPASPLFGCMSIKTRINNKIRALGAISSAGGMPERLRKFCDDGTPWLKSNAPLMLHGQWTGDIYAGADLERLPQTEQDWQRLYFLRRLSTRQHQQARELGVKMVQVLHSGRLVPFTIENFLHPAVRWAMNLFFTIRPPYRVAR
ncbi:MAG: flavodoxin family protein [Deltaproteobacteria bacterium]|nr:flavodoxin family protein [Deltaproteobacteria bacterium]